uniref:Uncharacterized protein n=1 Tax=Rhizophora mucronata TaxID=61149 RepID=A0A2P2JL43_RHIMU
MYQCINPLLSTKLVTLHGGLAS